MTRRMTPPSPGEPGDGLADAAARQPVPVPHKERIARTWHDAYLETEEFQGLLKKYANYQEAVDAWLRGERGNAKDGGNANPM
jgi:hypothetical protein